MSNRKLVEDLRELCGQKLTGFFVSIEGDDSPNLITLKFESGRKLTFYHNRDPYGDCTYIPQVEEEIEKEASPAHQET